MTIPQTVASESRQGENPIGRPSSFQRSSLSVGPMAPIMAGCFRFSDRNGVLRCWPANPVSQLRWELRAALDNPKQAAPTRTFA